MQVRYSMRERHRNRRNQKQELLFLDCRQRERERERERKKNKTLTRIKIWRQRPSKLDTAKILKKAEEIDREKIDRSKDTE